MVKVKAVVSYDGSNYNGFQIQNNAKSIQEEIQLALFKITKNQTKITGSGRTDKGVHAFGQVFTFESDINMNENSWMKALNSNLPLDIRIKNIEFVDESFHARFSATEKTYEYILNMGDFNPLKKDYEMQLCKQLDIEKMLNAAQMFIGTHDFRYFCSNSEDEVDSFVKTINSFDISANNNIVKFVVKGSGFLRYQVRMMVGTLIEIGLNRKEDKYILDRLDAKEGTTTSFNAPSCGLYLVEVKY